MPVRLRQIICSTLLPLLLFAGSASHAHQPGLSTIFVDLGTNRIAAQLIVAWTEVDRFVPLDSNRDGVLSDDEFSAASERVRKAGESAVSMESDGRMLSLKSPV